MFGKRQACYFTYSVVQSDGNSFRENAIGEALKPNCMKIFFKCAFSVITHKILNLHNKIQQIFAFYIFGIKCCLHPYMPC